MYVFVGLSVHYLNGCLIYYLTDDSQIYKGKQFVWTISCPEPKQNQRKVQVFPLYMVYTS